MPFILRSRELRKRKKRRLRAKYNHSVREQWVSECRNEKQLGRNSGSELNFPRLRIALVVKCLSNGLASFYVHLTQASVIWEERTSLGKMLLPDLPVGKSVSILRISG